MNRRDYSIGAAEFRIEGATYRIGLGFDQTVLRVSFHFLPFAFNLFPIQQYRAHFYFAIGDAMAIEISNN